MNNKIIIPVAPQDHLSVQSLVGKHCLCIERCTSEPEKEGQVRLEVREHEMSKYF